MASTPHFQTPSGPVEGWLDGPVARATGIRYATAERFRKPEPVDDWSETVAATTWSPACPQAPVPFLEEVLGSGIGDLEVDEHCQRLSVTLPADLQPDEVLPVMVWIHGGSYTSAAGDAKVMDPAPLVAEQRVVAVTVTYRLGMFGFLGGSDARPANLGLLDIVEAFRWVRRNIKAFGGDPSNVTAFGQSAGADAIAQLMALPDAASLFRRAIIQSAPLGVRRGRERMNAAMLEATADVTASMSIDAVVRAQSAAQKAASAFGLRGAMSFGTQYGHAPLPAEAGVHEAWNRAAPHIDVLIGYTAEEARLFVPRIPATKRLSDVPLLGRPLAALVQKLLTEEVYGRDARRFARRHASAGGRASTYVVSWSAPGNPWGAAHTVDLPLLFGHEETWRGAGIVEGASWSEIDAHARRMRAVWGDFARGALPSTADDIPGVARFRRLSSQ